MVVATHAAGLASTQDGAADEFVAQMITPTLTRALQDLCKARPADPVSFLAQRLLWHKPPPPMKPAPADAEPVVIVYESPVPTRVAALFSRLDLNGDGRISRAELTQGLESDEFPELTEHARAAVPALWAAHAPRSEDSASSSSSSDEQEGAEDRFLDLKVFNSFYAAMLFASFDVDNTGFLSLDQATRALDFLQPNASAAGVAYAFPASDDAEPGVVRLGADWFWSVFQRMK
jgi:Ca2+-binding EF-hand superfamily protein